MKKTLFLMAMTALMLSCKTTSLTEVRPMSSDISDTTMVLVMEDSYPNMRMIPGKPVHLEVKTRSGNTHTTTRDEIESALKMKVRYLPLETTEDCLMAGSISKIETDGSSIFVFDSWHSQAFRFSLKDGSFMNAFGQKGRGPGEYVNLSDMSLNRKTKEVCLVDHGAYKCLYYDYDGHWLREEPMYYYYSGVAFVGDRMVQYTGGSQNTMAPSVNYHQLILARQSDQTPEYVAFPFSETYSREFSMGNPYPLITCNENVYYTDLLSDTIWQVKPSGMCETRYVFKFPGRDNLFDEDDIRNMSSELYKRKTEDAKSYNGCDMRITEDYVFARPCGSLDMLYCIPTGHCWYGRLSCNPFGMPEVLFNPDFLALKGKTFVKVLQPHRILNNIKRTVKRETKFTVENLKDNVTETKVETDYIAKELTEEERQLLEKMTAEDNPILMIVDIEPF